MHTNNLQHHHIHVNGFLSGGMNILAIGAMIPCVRLDNKRDTTYLGRNKKTHICTRHFGMRFHHRMIILIPIILTFVPREAFDTKSSLEKVIIGPRTDHKTLPNERRPTSLIHLCTIKSCWAKNLSGDVLKCIQMKMFEFRLAFHWSLFLCV